MHTLIVGRTESGKSALAKQIGSRLRNEGHEVLAFNPTKEDGYTHRDKFGCAAAEWETDNPDEFHDEVLRRIKKTSKPRIIIIDEAHSFYTRSECHYLWMGTQGRHYGLTNIAITQRGALINPTFRSQCANLYLFRCSFTDAKFISDEYGSKTLSDAPSLPVGTYYVVTSESIDKGKVF